jgi:biotin operon repressor
MSTTRKKKGPKSKATKFTYAKLCWIEQVARDNRNLPSLASAVCSEFLHHFNLRYDGAARVAQETLAQPLGVRREAINKVIKALVAHGHLTSTRRGRDIPNEYRFVLQDEAAARSSRCARKRTSSAAMMCDLDVRDSASRCAQPRTQTPFTPGEAKEASPRGRESDASASTPAAPSGTAGAAPGAVEVLQENKKQEIIEPPRVPLPNQDGFAAWSSLRALWVRPWPDDHEADRRAFVAACQQAAPEEIIEAAREWVEAADAPRFLPSLAKWLAADGWQTLPPKRRPKQRANDGYRRNGNKVDLAALCLAHADGSLKISTPMWGDGR